MNNKYQPVIGLEIHIELATQSKMFCGCKAWHFGAEPNTQTCPVCLGLPGALPVPNKKAVDWTIMLGLALNCQISKESKFDRKNYFYPDLPKGYQISQYDAPLCKNGHLEIKTHSDNYDSSNFQFPSTNVQSNPKSQFSNTKTIRIRRVHLEEDTGKLLHTEINGEKCTLIDFNRSGVPLVEVVTEPDFETVEEVDEFLKKLRLIIRYLGISSADMEKGSMRLEPNISIRQLPITNDQLPNYKVEVKNINSFRFVKRSIEYEIARQIELLEKGETPAQETRGWNEKQAATVSQRGKEEAHDYRYFPEPDIPPMSFDQTQIAAIKSQIPELPNEKIKRFVKQYGITEYDAEILCQEKNLADFYEKAAALGKEKELLAKQIANWLINSAKRYMSRPSGASEMSRPLGASEMSRPSGASESEHTARYSGQDARYIETPFRYSGQDARYIETPFRYRKPDIGKTTPETLIQEIVESLEVVVFSEKELEKAISQVITKNQKAVEDYKNGKTGVLGFLIGEVVKKTNPKIDKKLVQQKLIQRL